MAGRLLPGAIQLEVARRLNVHATDREGRDDAAHRDLVDTVLAASAPGRGQPDLQLVDVHDGSPFGPPPVDPADLPDEELVRMAVGVLADRLLADRLLADRVLADPARGPSTPAPPRALPAAPWRRGWHLAGDPLLADHTRAALHDAGRRPGRRAPIAVLLADDLAGMLADTWTWRVQHRVTPSWRWWVGHWARRDQLPPRLDLTTAAAHWAGRVGRDRVHLVVGAPLPAALLGAPAGPPAAPLSPEAGELVRRVNEVLRLLATPQRHQRLLDDVLVPLLSDERGARPAVPPRWQPWVRGRAERLVEELSAAGYPVHGDLAALLPRAAEGPAAASAARVLDVALRVLLRTRDEKAGTTGAREVAR